MEYIPQKLGTGGVSNGYIKPVEFFFPHSIQKHFEGLANA